MLYFKEGGTTPAFDPEQPISKPRPRDIRDRYRDANGAFVRRQPAEKPRAERPANEDISGLSLVESFGEHSILGTIDDHEIRLERESGIGFTGTIDGKSMPQDEAKKMYFKYFDLLKERNRQKDAQWKQHERDEVTHDKEVANSPEMHHLVAEMLASNDTGTLQLLEDGFLGKGIRGVVHGYLVEIGSDLGAAYCKMQQVSSYDTNPDFMYPAEQPEHEIEYSTKQDAAKLLKHFLPLLRKKK